MASNTVTNSMFVGRLRVYSRGTPFIHLQTKAGLIQDVRARFSAQPRSVSLAKPALPRQNRSLVLVRTMNRPSLATAKKRFGRRK